MNERNYEKQRKQTENGNNCEKESEKINKIKKVINKHDNQKSKI